MFSLFVYKGEFLGVYCLSKMSSYFNFIFYFQVFGLKMMRIKHIYKVKTKWNLCEKRFFFLNRTDPYSTPIERWNLNSSVVLTSLELSDSSSNNKVLCKASFWMSNAYTQPLCDSSATKLRNAKVSKPLPHVASMTVSPFWTTCFHTLVGTKTITHIEVKALSSQSI
jgi:hypothetical protein